MKARSLNCCRSEQGRDQVSGRRRSTLSKCLQFCGDLWFRSSTSHDTENVSRRLLVSSERAQSPDGAHAVAQLSLCSRSTPPAPPDMSCRSPAVQCASRQPAQVVRAAGGKQRGGGGSKQRRSGGGGGGKGRPTQDKPAAKSKPLQMAEFKSDEILMFQPVAAARDALQVRGVCVRQGKQVPLARLVAGQRKAAAPNAHSAGPSLRAGACAGGVCLSQRVHSRNYVPGLPAGVGLLRDAGRRGRQGGAGRSGRAAARSVSQLADVELFGVVVVCVRPRFCIRRRVDCASPPPPPLQSPAYSPTLTTRCPPPPTSSGSALPGSWTTATF